MTLYDLIHKLKDIALRLPNVRTFAEGSVYDVMNGKNDIEYDCIVLSQDTHRADESFNYFTFNIFYISRLVSDMEENRLQVQSLGIEVLNNLFNILSDKYDIEIENNIQYNPFTQKFVDECCGVYASLVLNVPKEFLCAEQLFSDNSAPIISIKNVTISKEYTKNGDYSITYDKLNYTGIERVEVKVAVDYTDELNSAREDGYNQGNAEGYAKGTQDGYDNGYAIGEEVGYNNGLEVGKEEQKALLESVTITKNGTYTKDDGYSEVIVDVSDLNGSYDEGFTDGREEGVAQAGEIIAETAQVLNITENGTYVSQYSDPIYPNAITGVYPDGENFYSYAKLEGIAYDSGFLVSEDMEVEIWWKGDVSRTDKNLFGSQVNNNNAIFKIRIPGTAYRFEGEIAMTQARYLGAENDRWYHFKISYADGFWVDGVKMGDFTANISGTPYNLYINSNTPYSFNGADGYFGMIKITTNGVQNIIIPTAQGLKNITTDEILEVSYNGNYNFIEELPTIPEGNLIKTVNVNVQPKVDVSKMAIKFGYSNFTNIPEIFDFSNVTDMRFMFSNCIFQTISKLDTRNATDMYNMFNSCGNLQTIPQLNTSNVTNMSYMFSSCGNLQTISELDTSNVTQMGEMFYECKSLKSLPPLNVSNVKGGLGTYFRYDFLGDMNELTDVGGWIGLKINWDNNYGLARCPNLTYESCINILNGLADVTELGSRTLKVHQNFINLVGDEINIAVQKGWQVLS